MTKVRPPVSFADAVTRIAGRIGWDGAAQAVGKAERTVRNWSDPDTGALPTIEDALRLDAAYLAAGGAEAPIAAVFLFRLDREAAVRADPEQLMAATATAAREAGEAVSALVVASQPGASPQARAVAQKEIAEAIEALKETQHRLGSSGAAGARTAEGASA